MKVQVSFSGQVVNLQVVNCVLGVIAYDTSTQVTGDSVLHAAFAIFTVITAVVD